MKFSQQVTDYGIEHNGQRYRFIRFDAVTAGSIFVGWAVALRLDRLYGFTGWPRLLPPSASCGLG